MAAAEPSGPPPPATGGAAKECQEEGQMERAYGLEIPRTLEEVCDPRRLALLVYDMQEGIFAQAPGLRAVIPHVAGVLEAARQAGVRTVFTRHMSLPKELMGVSQLRTAMAWQGAARVADVRSLFLRDSPGFQLIPEMAPRPSEAVLDKLGMSAFAGTPLDLVLRDCGVVAVAVVGVVLEIGIAPTVSHATDLGFVPVVVADACGSVEEEARRRALADIAYTLMSLTTETAPFVDLLRRAPGPPAAGGER
jgi:nicotinamidase-related amidase